jgi:hypothetical protein
MKCTPSHRCRGSCVCQGFALAIVLDRIKTHHHLFNNLCMMWVPFFLTSLMMFVRFIFGIKSLLTDAIMFVPPTSYYEQIVMVLGWLYLAFCYCNSVANFHIHIRLRTSSSPLVIRRISSSAVRCCSLFPHLLPTQIANHC